MDATCFHVDKSTGVCGDLHGDLACACGSLLGKHTQPHYWLNLQMGTAAVWLCWNWPGGIPYVPTASRFGSSGPGRKNPPNHEADEIQ